MKINAYIIHLERSTDRFRNVQNISRDLNIPAHVIPAADGKILTPETISLHLRRRLFRPYYPFELTLGEIACFMSHRRAWDRIVSDGVDAGLVVEDDVSLKAGFSEALDLAADEIKGRVLVRFPHRDRLETGKILREKLGYRIVQPACVGLGMVAQLVSREAAIQLLEVSQKFDRPVDVLAQLPWRTGVNVLSINPSEVSEISKSLGGSTLKSSSSLSRKIRREILRPIYRSKVHIESWRRREGF